MIMVRKQSWQMYRCVLHWSPVARSATVWWRCGELSQDPAISTSSTTFSLSRSRLGLYLMYRSIKVLLSRFIAWLVDLLGLSPINHQYALIAVHYTSEDFGLRCRAVKSYFHILGILLPYETQNRRPGELFSLLTSTASAINRSPAMFGSDHPWYVSAVHFLCPMSHSCVVRFDRPSPRFLLDTGLMVLVSLHLCFPPLLSRIIPSRA